MAAPRLLGLIALLVATLGAVSADSSFSFGGKRYSTRGYLYFRNYYSSPIHWYFYKDSSFRKEVFDFTQPTYFSRGEPGSYFYPYKNYFEEGRTYYCYYKYGRGFSKRFNFKFTFSTRNRFSRNFRPYTFTAYPGRSGSEFEGDSSFQEDPSDFSEGS